MIKNVLGRTGLEVSQLGFGAMDICGPIPLGGREVTEGQVELLLNAVLDVGINFIDTSVDYGLSEERIGRHISSRRKEYYLATKCGCDVREVGDHIELNHLWTQENLWRNIQGSLERMKTDYVDILQLHNPTPEQVTQGNLVAVLEEIQSQGLTRHIGISTTLPHLPQFVQMGMFDTFQIPYSFVDPQHHDAISLAAEAGAGIIIRGGIAHGGPESDVAAWVGDKAEMRRAAWAAAREIAASARNKVQRGEVPSAMKSAELVLRYTLTHPHCNTTIVGTLNPNHLVENVAAAEKGPLPAELYEDVKGRLTKLLVEYQ